MRSHLRTALLATAIAIAGVGPALMPDVAQAQGYSRHDYRYFHRTLARYGDWVYSDRWGEVWIPNVSGDFRPYRSGGYWVNTAQYGWFWRSNYRWGDITFHYGRWVNDPYDGWLWIPGYVWSPGWVVWRGNNRFVGWMPMPPDRDFLRGNEFSVGYSIGGSGFSVRFGQSSGFYGYSSWYGRDYDESRFASNWTFVPTGRLTTRDYNPYVVNQTNVVGVINNTTNITNYTVVNNYVVNRSVDPRMVARASGQPVPTVKAAEIIRDPSLVTRVNEARQAQAQAPILRGTGQANSAPAPTPAVISTLSDKPVERNGRPARRLFNRETVTTAPLAPKAPAAGTAPSTQAPGGAVTPAPAPTTPNATPATPQPGTGPAETGGRNRDGTRGGRDNQGGVRGPATTAPTQNAPAMTPPANTTAPAETGGRNRGRGRGEQGNAPNGSAAPAPQNAPAAMAPPTNNPPAETGGRNRGRGRGEQGNAPNGSEAPAPQNAPAAMAPPTNNPPAETGGRNRGRERGRGEQGNGPSGNAAPAPQNAPAATPAPESNAPAENNRPNRERPRGGRGEQGNAPNGNAAPAPQNTPVATPPANTSAPDNGNPDRRKKKGRKDNGDNTDNQSQ